MCCCVKTCWILETGLGRGAVVNGLAVFMEEPELEVLQRVEKL